MSAVDAGAAADAAIDQPTAGLDPLPSDEQIVGAVVDAPAVDNERIGAPDTGAGADPLDQAAVFAEHHGMSEEQYCFIQKTSRWSRSVLPEPRNTRATLVEEHPDGAVTYRAAGSKPVTYFNGFPDFSPYVKKTRDGERIEAFFTATQDRGRDYTAWKDALAEKGLKPPAKCDFHHGPTCEVDGRIVVLGQALPHYIHKIAHSGGFSVAKAAAGTRTKRPRTAPSRRKGRAKRQSKNR